MSNNKLVMQDPYAFNERGNVEEVMNSNGLVVQYYKRLRNGEKLTRAEKDYLFHLTQSNSGGKNYMVMGVIIPFGGYFKEYWVSYNYGSIHSVYAPDKTAIRSSFYTNSGINKIVEIR